MKLSDGIQLAYQRKWSMINTFTVQFILPNPLVDLVGEFGEDTNLSIIGVQTPDFTNDPIEAFIANRWVIHNGKDALYRFSMTFRDYDQMSLYRRFMKIYNSTKENFFDDVSMRVIVEKDGDWNSEKSKKLMNFGGCLVEGVSNLAISNDSESQVAEFTVNFKCTSAAVY